MPSQLEESSGSGSGCKMWITAFPFCISPAVDLKHDNSPQLLKNPGNNFSPTTKMRSGPRSQNAQEERHKRYSRKDEATPIAGRRWEGEIKDC